MCAGVVPTPLTYRVNTHWTKPRFREKQTARKSVRRPKISYRNDAGKETDSDTGSGEELAEEETDEGSYHSDEAKSPQASTSASKRKANDAFLTATHKKAKTAEPTSEASVQVRVHKKLSMFVCPSLGSLTPHKPTQPETNAAARTKQTARKTTRTHPR